MPTITVFFATNRNPIGDPPADFGPDLGPIDGNSLRFGYAEVDERTLKVRDVYTAPETLVSPTGSAGDLVFGSREVFDAVRNKMAGPGRDTLVYIHGFNFDFKDALSYAAGIKKFYGVSMNIFLFTWPSDGEMIPEYSYYRDVKDVVRSGDALARAFLILDRYLGALAKENRCSQRIHVLAHSMGVFALRHAVQGILRQLDGPYPPRLIDKVILAAGDEDNDTFDALNKLAPLPRLAQQITVYHSARDRALTISETTKGNPERLGSDGPANARSLNDKVSVVDVSAALAVDDDLTNHQYYRLNRRVRDDIIQVLQGVRPIDVTGRVYEPDTRRFRLADTGSRHRGRER